MNCFYEASSLHSVDLTHVWLFLADTLSDSASHDDTTSRMIYSQIVSLIYGLVQLHRDLVISSLPDMAHTLSCLLDCLQAVQQDLGATQQWSITNTFPLWIQPSQPLGAEDAKVTARLLECLTTRTEVHSASYTTSSVGMAESLCGTRFQTHEPLSQYQHYTHNNTNQRNRPPATPLVTSFAHMYDAPHVLPM